MYLSLINVKKSFARIVLVLSFAFVTSGWNSLSPVRAQEGHVTLRQFGLLDANTGWVLLGGHLFWTSDTGQSWHEISPSLPAESAVQDVQFINSTTGWILWSRPDVSGGASFHLAHTGDGGRSWKTRALQLFEAGEAGSQAEKVDMGWFDEQTGWVSVKQISSSNFSLGWLFKTSDGGDHWSRLALPVADEIYFSDPQTGWAVGGPSEDEIYSSQDGGVTWDDVRPPELSGDAQAILYPPLVSDGGGLLLGTTLGTENHLHVYSLENSSNWLPNGQVKLEAQPGRIGISILDPHNFVATIPGTRSIVRMREGELERLENQDRLSAFISELDMVSLEVGWAKSIETNCVHVSAADQTVSCSSSTRLLQTVDGGMSWQNIDLPLELSAIVFSNVMDHSADTTLPDLSSMENTEIFIGQGFDKCEIPSLSQMQTWAKASPYQVVNLYIGGSSRACANSALTSSYLTQLYEQGWTFIPTWVGPQAPCTGYASRMSSDPSVAYQEGVSEANLAVERLAALGLTTQDKTGSVVYYDIEYYGTDPACRSTVNAFMNGWVAQMRARGNLAGVYGSTRCNTGLSDFLNITNVPDVIWPARWYHNLGEGYYDPDASVWDLGSCIPNSAWSDHQRIRQYEGDHTEIWGGLSLAIDSNVLDGAVALPRTTAVQVNLGETMQGIYRLVPNQMTHQAYANVDSGPVQIVSTGNSLIASERVIYQVNSAGTSFSEMMAFPNSQLDTTYWLPWYDNKDLNTQLRFANVSSSTANVHVTIGGVPVTGSPFRLLPGASTRKSFPGINRGPVKIVSNEPIVAAERIIYSANGVPSSFSEMMALPDSQLDRTYWLPWYNSKDLETQLRFANVSSTTATVRVKIGDVEMAPFTLASGRGTRKSYAGIDKGPVRIVSNVPIVAAEQVTFKVDNVPTSFSEMMALPESQTDTTYWLPWYNNRTMDTQLRIANVSSSTATVWVYIDEQEMTGSPFTLGPGASLRKSFARIDKGPVKIVSNVPIVAAQRVIYKLGGVPASFSEMMALPDKHLDTTHWLPWYNNKDLNTELRFGIPGT